MNASELRDQVEDALPYAVVGAGTGAVAAVAVLKRKEILAWFRNGWNRVRGIREAK